MAHIFSKSGFINGCQCPKRLFLYKYHYDERDELDEGQEAIFARGTDVGELAQQLFPGGVNVKPETPFLYEKSVKETQQYIEEGKTVIYS